MALEGIDHVFMLPEGISSIIFKRCTETGHVFAVERHGQHHLFPPHRRTAPARLSLGQILTIPRASILIPSRRGQTIAKPEQHLLTAVYNGTLPSSTRERHLAGGVIVHTVTGASTVRSSTRTRKVFPRQWRSVLREFFQLGAHHRLQPFPDFCPALAFCQCVKSPVCR
ncbi:hypothetical protein OIU92_00040 [Escherichia coli]|nr:hypothetical protein [Escherichia coli]